MTAFITKKKLKTKTKNNGDKGDNSCSPLLIYNTGNRPPNVFKIWHTDLLIEVNGL